MLAQVDGDVDAGSLNVIADGDNTATATTSDGRRRRAQLHRRRDARGDRHRRDGRGAGRERCTYRSDRVAARSDRDLGEPATATSSAASGGLVAATVNLPTATVSGATIAAFDGDVTDASQIAVSATSTNTATATPIVITAGAITLAGTEADADVTEEADTLASVGSAASITAPGAAVSVTANAHNHASATVTSASVGFASLTVMLPSATVAGATKASFDGDLNDVATDAQSLTVEAVAENQVTTSVYIISVTVAGASGAYATAIVVGDHTDGTGFHEGANTVASVGSSASIATSGLVKVDAHLQGVGNKATASTDIDSGALFGSLAIAASLAEVGAGTKATLDGAVAASGGVTVQATGDYDVDATTEVLAVGIGFAGAGAGANANVTEAANVEALVGGGVDLVDRGSPRSRPTGRTTASRCPTWAPAGSSRSASHCRRRRTKPASGPCSTAT